MSDVIDFVDSSCEASPSLRNEWGLDEGKVGEAGRGEEERTEISM